MEGRGDAGGKASQNDGEGSTANVRWDLGPTIGQNDLGRKGGGGLHVVGWGLEGGGSSKRADGVLKFVDAGP